MNPIAGIVAGIVKPIAGIFTGRQKTKVAIRKLETQEKLSDDEWELVSKQLEAGTWKDEFVTIVIYLPLITMMAGALLDPTRTLFESSLVIFEQINTLNTDTGYGQLLLWVTMAAIGFKALKR